MRIALLTLGCDKNTVDNEYLAGVLSKRGHSVVMAQDGKTRYDALVITTCGFIDAAAVQSLTEIDSWARQKRETGYPRRLIVAGCLSQTRAQEILHSFPEIDGIAGVGQIETLADVIEQSDPRSNDVCAAVDDPSMRITKRLPRRRLSKRPYAYLKIADGCDHRCAYCLIPDTKGSYASVPAPALVKEAQSLIDGGVSELNVIAQDISLYGRDLRTPISLIDLLKRLAALKGEFWIRLLYLYPAGIQDALLEYIASEPKICRYLEIPFQHLNAKLLKSMNRPAGQLTAEKTVERIRRILPDATLRTTFIVGLPGETDAMFSELLEGVQQLKFDRVGAFTYSPQLGTVAAGMSNQVPSEVAIERMDRLMRAQQEIHFEKNQRRVGQTERVLLEGRDREKSAAIGRSQSEAPEIDGYIYVKGATQKLQGRFADVKITKAENYDLWAELP